MVCAGHDLNKPLIIAWACVLVLWMRIHMTTWNSFAFNISVA